MSGHGEIRRPLRLNLGGEWAVAHCSPAMLAMQSLKEMVLELIKAFYQKNGIAPVKLIFFRDGVSEGEVGAVLSKEIPQVASHAMSYD